MRWRSGGGITAHYFHPITATSSFISETMGSLFFFFFLGGSCPFNKYVHYLHSGFFECFCGRSKTERSKQASNAAAAEKAFSKKKRKSMPIVSNYHSAPFPPSPFPQTQQVSNAAAAEKAMK